MYGTIMHKENRKKENYHMIWDESQKVLMDYLKETEIAMNELLSQKQYGGNCKIQPNIDLGFPHDVIRLGGGFATGIYVWWNSNIPFIPIDICMNVCTVSFYKLENIEDNLFNEKTVEVLLERLQESSYIANFHRGNHFISFSEDISTNEKYLIIHSSAAEFETMYNGLYPVEDNLFFENTKIYNARNGRYIRYLAGEKAELFVRLAENLYIFNENRHDFIINSIFRKKERIEMVSHYHHYGMPSANEAIIGCHLLEHDSCSPLLTRPGENIFLLKYQDTLLQNFRTGNHFITPHGLGKQDVVEPEILLNIGNKELVLDGYKYKLQYGESLRKHSTLKLRDISIDDFMSKMKTVYDFSIVKEYKQLASYNKDGFIRWK